MLPMQHFRSLFRKYILKGLLNMKKRLELMSQIDISGEVSVRGLYGY